MHGIRCRDKGYTSLAERNIIIHLKLYSKFLYWGKKTFKIVETLRIQYYTYLYNMSSTALISININDILLEIIMS